jgi:hypothetical protein
VQFVPEIMVHFAVDYAISIFCYLFLCWHYTKNNLLNIGQKKLLLNGSTKAEPSPDRTDSSAGAAADYE